MGACRTELESGFTISEGEKAFNPLFDSPPGSAVAVPPPVAIDPELVQEYLEDLRSQQSLLRGFAGGLISAMIGSAVWAVITVLTEYQNSWMAMGLGVLVGLGVRKYGKGLRPAFGIAAAFLAFAGTVVGNVLSCGAAAAKAQGLPLFAAELDLLTNPFAAGQALVDWFSPIDVAFYIFAIVAAYGFSFREVTESDAVRMIRYPSTEENDV